VDDLTRRSRHLSFVLRHRPDSIGIELEPGGWVAVDVLLAALARHGRSLSRAELDEVVARDAKRRYTVEDAPGGERIRAAQGHSADVDLGLAPADPPAVLWHGTTAAALTAIRRGGLQPRSRRMVHLSADRSTALVVGGRRGRPVLVRVDTDRARSAGVVFFRADNGVWLTQALPAHLLTFPDEQGEAT
jgi:putative RNA 2'-phosphotransferase